MKSFISKKELEIVLSKLKKFEDEDVDSNVFLEQYSTNDVLASDLIWYIVMSEDNKKFLDLGAGTGILGIGLLFFDFKVVFVEKDPYAVSILKQNLSFVFEEYKDYFFKNNIDFYNNFVIFEKDIFSLKKDFFEFYKDFFVVMNPPFGSKRKHFDKDFLIVSFNFDKVYSIHKFDEKVFSFFDFLSFDFGFSYKILFEKEFVLKKQFFFHKKKKKSIKVVVVFFEKNR